MKDSAKPRSQLLTVTILLLGLIVLVAVALWQLALPPVVPASALATEFSAERAMVDLAVIAREPHPTGSAAIFEVEQYIVQRLTQMGLKPEVQATTAVQVKGEFESVWAGEVRNIVVRIPGTDSTKPIALSAHYDSAAAGPGASDCGSCVVTVLETARAIKAGPPLKNDVILVFNNAEEHEMMGANAFVAEHPWARDIGLTINFEAQGSRGPAFMYATSPNSGWLVGEMAQVAPSPLGYSFLNNMISVLTARPAADLEEFMDAGSAGLGLIYAWNIPAYHSRLDNVANTDPRSIQQEGSTTLALVLRLGNLDLQPQIGDATYFNILPGVMISYPSGWSVPLAILAGLVLIGILAFGWRRRQLTIGGMLLGLVASVAALLAAVIVTTLTWWALNQIIPGLQAFMIGNYGSDFYVLGLALLTVATVAAIFALLRSRLTAQNLAAGGLLLIALLMALTSLAMPAGSYLFTWPLLAVSFGLAWWLLRAERARPWEKVAVLLLTAAPSLALFVPLAYMFVPLTSRAEALSTVPFVGIPMAFLALMLGSLLLQLETLSARGRWLVPAGALGLSVVMLLAGALTSGYNNAQPRPNMVAYHLNADTGEAAWLTVDETLDAYTSRFQFAGSEKTVWAPMPSESPDFEMPARKSPAPKAALPAPGVELTNVSKNGEETSYRLHVRSARQALNIELVARAQGEITSGMVNNKRFDLNTLPADRRNLLRLQYYGVPVDGFDLTVTTRSPSPIVVTAEDRSYGLPSVPGYDVARPASFMPSIYELTDATVVRKTYQFP